MRRLMATLVLLTACSANPPTTTSNVPSSTTSSLATSTTLPAVQEPLPFESERFTLFLPDTRYQHQPFVVPVEFRFQQDGWISDAQSDTAIGFYSADSAEGDVIAANIGILEEGVSIAAAESSYRNQNLVVDSTPSTRLEVSGVEVVTLDVLLDVPPEENPPRRRPCDNRLDLLIPFPARGQQGQWDRNQLTKGAACGWNRIWLVELEDTVVVLHASHLVPSEGKVGMLEDLQPFLDDFISAITFCTEQTLCDE